MPAWKLIMFQSFLLRNRCPELLYSSDGKSGDIENRTADSDSAALQSPSSLKEGAEPGFNKKNKGKPCFQLSAAFIGRCFPDVKLFPGYSSPETFFQKSVRRMLSPGYNIKIIRAGSACMTVENILFLSKKGPGYAIGAPGTFNAVKEGIKKFRKLSRQKSSRIIYQLQKVFLFMIPVRQLFPAELKPGFLLSAVSAGGRTVKQGNGK